MKTYKQLLESDAHEIKQKGREYSSYYKVNQLNVMLKKAFEEKNDFEFNIIAEALRNLGAWKGLSFRNGKPVWNNLT